MDVKIFENVSAMCQCTQPFEVNEIDYVAPAKDQQGWVLVKKDSKGQIILPLGVVIETFEDIN